MISENNHRNSNIQAIEYIRALVASGRKKEASGDLEGAILDYTKALHTASAMKADEEILSLYREIAEMVSELNVRMDGEIYRTSEEETHAVEVTRESRNHFSQVMYTLGLVVFLASTLVLLWLAIQNMNKHKGNATGHERTATLQNTANKGAANTPSDRKSHTPTRRLVKRTQISSTFSVAETTPVMSFGESKTSKDEIVIGTTNEITVLDPAGSYDFPTWEVQHNTMDTLLHYAPGTTNLEPGIAEAMPDVSNDGKVYTFKLRKGLKFPDGNPVDAKAVEWSINRVARLGKDPSWLVTSFVDHIEAVDDLTVRFYLKEPVNYFPFIVATTPYSPVSPKCYDANKVDRDSTCSGFGPYKITNWVRNQEIDLQAYEGYKGKFVPKVEHVVVKYYSDPVAMQQDLESGKIDLITEGAALFDYEELRHNQNLQVVDGPGPIIGYLCFNVKTKPFDNVEIREAIASAVDRNAIANKAFMGVLQPLYSMVPAGMWSHIDAFRDKYGERDLSLSKRLLKEAGFSASHPLEMELWWTPAQYGIMEFQIASLVKESLEETGVIRVTLQSADWSTYKRYIDSGRMSVFLLGWYPDYLDPDNYTYPFAASDASKGMGIFYSSAKMNALLESGRSARDLRSDGRKVIYEQIQRLWAEEVPTLPLVQNKWTVAAQKNIKGILLDTSMRLHYFLLYK